MYNEKIEGLISAALADGVLTEKEKQVLFKKAQAEGIDLDEFEIVLDARLVELEKAEKAKKEAAAPKSNKYGDIRKCPVCGAMVPALAGTCPECGYEFSGVDANLSSKQLAEKLETEAAKWDGKITDPGTDEAWELSKAKEAALAQIVRSFTVPNAKNDLFEFISTAQFNFLSSSTNYYLAEGYLAKYKEALYKAKHLFSSDKLFDKLLAEQTETEDQFRKIHKKQPKVGMKPSAKVLMIMGICFAIFFAVAIPLAIIFG